MKHVYHVSCYRLLNSGTFRQQWHGLVRVEPPASDPGVWYNELVELMTAQLNQQLQDQQADVAEVGPLVIESLTDLGPSLPEPAVDTRNS